MTQLPDDAPYTDEELTDEQIVAMRIPDQIAYAVWKGNHTVEDIVAMTAHERAWVEDMAADMAEDGVLIEEGGEYHLDRDDGDADDGPAVDPESVSTVLPSIGESEGRAMDKALARKGYDTVHDVRHAEYDQLADDVGRSRATQLLLDVGRDPHADAEPLDDGEDDPEYPPDAIGVILPSATVATEIHLSDNAGIKTVNEVRSAPYEELADALGRSDATQLKLDVGVDPHADVDPLPDDEPDTDPTNLELAPKVSESMADRLRDGGFETLHDLRQAGAEELTEAGGMLDIEAAMIDDDVGQPSHTTEHDAEPDPDAGANATDPDGEPTTAAHGGQIGPKRSETDGGAVTTTPERPGVPEATDDPMGTMPVDRDYDWDSYVPDPADVEDYVSADGEFTDVLAEIETRHETGRKPRFRITGPTGCGKSSLVYNAAVELDAPVFKVNCHEGLRPGDLIGSPTFVGDQTWWIDGKGTKALQCSRERLTFLFFDEVNRTTARTLGAVMQILDWQCEVSIPQRGGEVVSGDPMNLIVFATMNDGEGYIVNSLDRAQLRRFGNEYQADFLGLHDADAEAELVAERTPVSESVARTLVDASNEIRRKAKSEDSQLKMGVPTSTVISWAQTAWAFRDYAGDGGPLVKAAQKSVINPFYDDRETVESTVETTIESAMKGMPVDHDGDGKPVETLPGVEGDKAQSLRDAGYETTDDMHTASQSDLADVDGIGNALAARIKAHTSDGIESPTPDTNDELYYQCMGCGFGEDGENVDDDVKMRMKCPDCGETLVSKESPP